MMSDYTPHQMVCPSCSGPSSTGSNCASCLAIPEPVIDTNSWIKDILTDAYPVYDIDNPPPDLDDDLSMEVERVCPCCSGPSPTGGYCASCLATMDDERRADDDLALDASAFGDPIWGEDRFDDVIMLGEDGTPLEGLNERFKPDKERRQPEETDLEDHHIYPGEFRDKFREVGVRINDDTATIYRFQHEIVHSEGWNDEWRMFWEMAEVSGVDPIRDDVVDYGRFLMEKYGFPEAVLHEYKDKSGDLGPYLM
jgi:hypothetical protein